MRCDNVSNPNAPFPGKGIDHQNIGLFIDRCNAILCKQLIDCRVGRRRSNDSNPNLLIGVAHPQWHIVDNPALHGGDARNVLQIFQLVLRKFRHLGKKICHVILVIIEIQ